MDGDNPTIQDFIDMMELLQKRATENNGKQGIALYKSEYERLSAEYGPNCGFDPNKYVIMTIPNFDL